MNDLFAARIGYRLARIEITNAFIPFCKKHELNEALDRSIETPPFLEGLERLKAWGTTQCKEQDKDEDIDSIEESFEDFVSACNDLRAAEAKEIEDLKKEAKKK